MRTYLFRFALAISSAALWYPLRAQACDVCSLYSAIQFENPQQGAIRLSIAEQFTDLRTIREEGKYVENSANQYLKTSATQLSLQYDATPTTAWQVVLPVLGRAYRRIEDGEVERGSDFGIGDMSLIFHYVPLQYSEGRNLARFRIYGGVELPTGDAHYLGEEAGGEDMHEYHADEHAHGDDEIANAVHGHDLALGSGSVDFPLGASFITQWNQFVFSSDVQFNIRTEGAYSYQYANDWFWATTFGRYLYLGKESQVILRARLSGQYKREDTLKGGNDATDTALNAKYLGPELVALLAEQWQGNIGFDLPIDVKNSDYHVTPSWMLRAALTYRF